MPAGCSSRSWPPPDRDTARLRAAAGADPTVSVYLGISML
jgi:hypothetical protein